MVGLLVLAILVVAYGLVSRRFEGTIVTAPMVFVAGGLLLGLLFVELHEVPFEYGLFLVIGEIALALTLFTDASRIHRAVCWSSVCLSPFFSERWLQRFCLPILPSGRQPSWAPSWRRPTPGWATR
jgi:hypothetical protein